jgi:purine nucleosidase
VEAVHAVPFFNARSSSPADGREKSYQEIRWDISTVAYLNLPDSVPTELRPSPVLRADLTWGPEDQGRHPVREAWTVRRDAVFADLFRKLAQHAAGGGTA